MAVILWACSLKMLPCLRVFPCYFDDVILASKALIEKLRYGSPKPFSNCYKAPTFHPKTAVRFRLSPKAPKALEH